MATAESMHFISGLPRSGSTLLSAILRQNPRFHAGITSPVGSLFRANLEVMSAGSEFAAVLDERQREAILRGIFTSYYGALTDRPVIIDTNRLWASKLPAVRRLFPRAKVICCVRNVAWIMDSIERLIRRQPFENTKLFNNEVERNTVYSRVDTLAQRDRLVGFAWTALKEAYYGEHADSLLLVDYDLLVAAPEDVINLVYGFIGEPLFEHDFDDVVFDSPAFDSNLGVAGLHKVHRKVAPRPRQSVLPPDLFEKYSALSFWNDAQGSPAHVIRPQPKTQDGQEAGQEAELKDLAHPDESQTATMGKAPPPVHNPSDILPTPMERPQ